MSVAAAETTASIDDPLELPCGFTLSNRLVKAAMSEGLGDRKNAPNERLTRLYERWGCGGVGMLITGNVMVDRRSLGEPGNVVIEDDRNLAALTEWATAAKAGGAAAIVQINHPGRQMLPGLGSEVVAPSAIRIKTSGAPWAMPRALTGPEIEALIERYATAAEVSVRAGFDGIQLHGAHGYLISQFLSPRANQRDDEWGGDAERRRRFVIELVRATRSAMGAGKILSVKLNSADFQRGGFSEDESLAVIAALESEGVDLLEISGGSYESPAMMGAKRSKKPPQQKASTVAREAYFLEFAERARAVTAMPLMITGGLRSARAMQEARQAGIDVVGIARPVCLEPDLPAALLADNTTVSRLAPVRTGIRVLDPVAELFWNATQLRRMSIGKEPDAHLGGRRALLRVLMRDGKAALRRRRA